MNPLTRIDIVNGLRELGLDEGDRVLVHSSLLAFGRVEGGADTVIDALLETVGREGLVVVPTFACKSPFDRKNSVTPLGKISETFWRRPEAVRSLHPTHSVAAIGNGAKELIRDHEKAPTAYGEDTPYVKLAEMDGKILLLGVDQDRNTSLHAGEAIVRAPYLKDIEATYIDDDGKEVTIPIAGMAGPHRDFICMDRLFLEMGMMSVGRIGKAVCRLIDAKGMLEVEIEALNEDPAAVLCDNPECADCVMQRGMIKAAVLGQEDFTLAVVASDISDDPSVVLKSVAAEGITTIELTAEEYPKYKDLLNSTGAKISAIRGIIGDTIGRDLAAELGVPFIVPVRSREEIERAARLTDGKSSILIENEGATSSVYVKAYSEIENLPLLAFNPRHFASVGENAFLGVFYKGMLRKETAYFYVDDGTFAGKPTFPGRGNGEVKEIISMLRCRGYDGVITLRSHGGDVDSFHDAAAWFWNLLKTI